MDTDHTMSELPWLDRPDAAERIANRLARGELDEQQAEALAHWSREGYTIVRDVLEADLAAEINTFVDGFVAERIDRPREEWIFELQDLFRQHEPTKRAMCHPRLLELVDLLLGVRALPYQTLSLPYSSQQGLHSDEVLMTTRPRGYLVAAWVALEDIEPDSGPLVILPGSHRLPYVSAGSLGIPRATGGAAPIEAECNAVCNERYYPHVRKLAEKSGLEPFEFVPKRGDALLWHSNLLHGAMPITRAGATRRSLVVHYFGEGAEHYSDLYDRPCDLPALR